MESYEQFYLHTLTKLQSKRRYDKTCLTSGECIDTSFISFQGTKVLSPVLNEKQRKEMAHYRQIATKLKADKQTQCQKNLLNEVQKIMDNRVNAFILPDSSKLSNNNNREILTSIDQALNNKHEVEMERGDESANEGMSLQSLLRKSREYIEKEQSWRGSKDSSRSPTSVPAESPLDKDIENRRPASEADSNLSSYIQYHSPLSPSQPKTPTLPKPKPTIDAMLGLESLPGCPPQSLLNTEASLSSRPHRGRPRPVSACNFLFSYSGSPREPGITAKGRSPEGTLPCGLERRLLEVEGISGSRRASHSGSSPVNERGGVTNTIDTGHDLIETGFRRRCHTMDSNMGPPYQSPPIDRSQERIPRFMAGVPQRTPPRRSPPSQLSATFTLTSPSSPTSSTLRSSLNPDFPIIPHPALDEKRTDELQWRVQVLGDMQRCLKEEQQAFHLMAEQGREKLIIQQEPEDKEKWLRDLGGMCAVVGELGGDWKAGSECYPPLTTSCPMSPAEILPGSPSIGFHSPVSSGAVTPSMPPPVYLWGPNRGVNKSRNRLSLVLTPQLQKAMCRLTAIVQGFLTRQLLKTEKVKNLRQTVKDTQDFISSFHKEEPQKKGSLTEQDLSLQERVRAQLRAALFDIHDIFFEMSLDERLALLQQERELRTERKLREMEKAKSPKEKINLSAATQKVLDRKKQRVGESPSQTRRIQQKPKSPLTNRSSQRKTPEDRVKRSDCLKKQHSLG
ncbi:centriolar coiled-coil protein of 110 kDa [Astyanax mexicanus]|uniref:centriolar coiled-coil protein of 110 kDa n=1 Tax=Astyanax mexicanus TaxID=7994 RepID=UPI0020CB1476|nr:centriolar coiled-coil protein of 110 kDa [Astyanax mexicanus]